MQEQTLIPILERFNAAVMPHAEREHFVGAVYDTLSPDGDLPTALVVGINYGQIGTSHATALQARDVVGYAGKVARVTGREPCHTVLWNFYPYLTDDEWLVTAKNAAREAELVFSDGYADPIGTFMMLEAALSPDVIVFHGIRSVVPPLAHIALARIGRSAWLVPNLSRPFAQDAIRRIDAGHRRALDRRR